MPGAWVDLDLDRAVIYVNGLSEPFGEYNGTDIRGASTNSFQVAFGHLDFALGVELDTTMLYEVEITFDPASTNSLTQISGHPDNTNESWWTWPNHADIAIDSPGDVDVHTTTIGPGVDDWAQAVAGGYNGLTFQFTHAAIVTGIRYRWMETRKHGQYGPINWDVEAIVPTPGVGWTNPLLLTSPDPFGDGNDSGSLPTADLCWLGGDIVVLKSFSYDSYAIRLWAIDVSSGTPEVGPVLVVNGDDDDFSWMTDPHPGDAKGQAMYDSAHITALPGNKFAFTGGANENYDAAGNNTGFSGDYIHVASFFEVNPSTLVITRTAFVIQEYDVLPTNFGPTGGWLDDVTQCAWGEKLVIVPNDYPYILIASEDGTTEVFPFEVPSYDLLGHPVAIGDEIFFTAYDFSPEDDYTLFKLDPADGTITQGSPIVGSDDYQTSWFVCQTDDGAAFLMTNNNVGNKADRTMALVAADLTADEVVTVAPDTWRYGWTSDFNGPVASLTMRPDGNFVVSYVDIFTRVMYVVPVSANKAPGAPDLLPFPNTGAFFVQCAKACAVGNLGTAAVYIRQSSGVESEYTYGVNFSYNAGVVAPTVPSTRYIAQGRFWTPR